MISPALTDCTTDTECTIPRCDTKNHKHLAEFYGFIIECIIKGLNETRDIFLGKGKIDIVDADELLKTLPTIKTRLIEIIDSFSNKKSLEKESLSNNLKDDIEDVTDKMIEFYKTIKQKANPNLLDTEIEDFKTKNSNMTDQYKKLEVAFKRLKTEVDVSSDSESTTATETATDTEGTSITETARTFVPAPTPAPAPAPAQFTTQSSLLDNSSESAAENNSQFATFTPAPAPAPGPAPGMYGSIAPGPSSTMHGSVTHGPAMYAPAPGPASTSYSPGITSNVDYTSYGLLNQNLTHKLESVIGSQLGVQIKPTFREELGKLVVFIKSIDYSSLTANKKLNLEKSVQKEVHDFLLLKFRNTRDSKFQVDLSRINVVAMSGSTYLVIQITPKTVKHSLSNTDKDMLEFYNFMSVLQRGQIPIRENDYLNHHYPFNR